ncbi:hypothetical protein KFE25_001749 [Diacronema lutheri]|uniref:Uncharacterized protein n=1 Tax=Diacronema lutheri TaxID=2081491 RepID=A0A8J5XCH0_DIALT|nr:hypothetical protein KFE25_001749 [Diacronema lutheri]
MAAVGAPTRWTGLVDEVEGGAPAAEAPDEPAGAAEWDGGALASPAARLLNRLALCILALALLWLTSLRASAAVADAAVPPVALADVIDACAALSESARTERDAHASCARLQADRCTLELDSAVVAAAAAAAAARAANRATLDLLRARAERCAHAREAARAALRTIAAAGVDLADWLPARAPTGACDARARNAAAGETGAGADADGAFAVGDAAALASAAAAERGALLDALRERARYDADYIAAKGAQLRAAGAAARGALGDGLRALNASLRASLPMGALRCVSLGTDGDVHAADDAADDDVGTCPPGASARAAVAGALEQLSAAYDGARTQAESTQARARALREQAVADLARAEAVLSRLRAIETALAAAGVGIGSIPPPTWPLPPIPSFELAALPPSLASADLRAILPAGVYATASDLRAALLSLPAIATSGAAAAFEAAAARSLDPLPTLLADYDPPPIAPLEAAAARAARADADAVGALARVRAALSAPPDGASADVAERAAGGAAGRARAAAARARETPAAAARPAGSGELGEPLEVPRLEAVGAWLASRSAALGRLALHVDGAARALASARVVARFAAGGSAAGEPAIDVRPFAAAALSSAAGGCGALALASPAALAFRALTSPLAWMTLVAVLAFAVGGAATTAWAAAYGEYVAACRPADADGGLLTRNAYAVAFDWAAQPGDRTLGARLAEHERARARACAELRASVGASVGAGGGEDGGEGGGEDDGPPLALQREADILVASAAEDARALRALRACGAAALAATRADNLDAHGRPPSDALAALARALDEDECAPDTPDAPSRPVRPSDGDASNAPDTAPDAPDTAPGALARGGAAPRLHAEGVACASALPACTPTCTGPSRPLLRALARRCGCLAEGGAHAQLSRWLLAAGTFAALNAARALLVGGLARVGWREVFSGSFEYAGSCDALGTPAEGTARALRVAVARAGDGLRAGGRVRCAGALAVLVAWASALAYSARLLRR